MRRKHPPGPAFVRRRAFVRAGFTLVEMVLVVAVIGVVAAIAVPRYAQSQSRYHAQSGAQRVAADLEAALERARLSGSPVSVTFTVGKTTYVIAATVGGSATSEDIDLGIEPYLCVVTDATFGGKSEVSFSGHGVPASAGTVRVQTGRTACVVTLSAAGVVTIGPPTVIGTRVKIPDRAGDDAMRLEID